MNTTFIILLSFSGILAGCSSAKQGAKEKVLKITTATYQEWREAPLTGSEVPEVGTDLTVMVENWKKGYVPAFVVFRGKKSVSAEITNVLNAKGRVIIHAKIIRSSSVLTEKSDITEVSDRLVYANPNGDTEFIEIREWKEAGQ